MNKQERDKEFLATWDEVNASLKRLNESVNKFNNFLVEEAMAGEG